MASYTKEPQQPAVACVIWLHGLGSSAADMGHLVEQLDLKTLPLRHVFLDAPHRAVTINNGIVMPAWYDITGSSLTDREDEEGIKHSAQIINQAITHQLELGVRLEHIILAGFSQGGAMALYAALTTVGQLGGVISLSAYLPLSRSIKPILASNTPFFIAHGQFDPVVLPQWTYTSKEWVRLNGYKNIMYKQYPIEHSVCIEEISDIHQWLTDTILG